MRVELQPLAVAQPAGQAADAQSPAAQATSQLHASAQSTVSHAPWVWHSTSHAPVPQLTLPHALLDEQVTVQLAASSQWTVLQALLPLQSIVQSKPAGQLGEHRSPVPQLISQVFASRSHESHSPGHCTQ